MIVLEFGRGIMKIFLAIKYYEDMKNKNLIEKICSSFECKNITVFVFARNVQNYGPCKLSGKEVMDIAFEEIKRSDAFVIDASELSIGIGVEAGVAYSNDIPVFVIAQKDAYVSESIKGIAKDCFRYDVPEDILNFQIRL